MFDDRHPSTTGRLHLTRLLAAGLLTAGLAWAGCSGTDGDSDGPGQNNPDDPGDENVQRTEKDGFTEIRSRIDRDTDPSADLEAVETLTSDNADFATDLYAKLAAQKEGENLFFSPHSISTALAMTYAGAEGQTATEMKKALRFDMPESKLHPAFNRLALELESRAEDTGELPGGQKQTGNPFELTVANSIWGQKDFSFQQPFLDTMAQHYGAGLRALNFAEKPDASRKTINKWVADQTNDKIEDLLPKDSITSLTRMVLTNAIYFKASWKHKFDRNATTEGEFNLLDGSTVQADMMRLQEKDGLAYAEGDAWKAVEMPYVGDEMSMVVIVPDAGKFAQVEGKLSGQWLDTVFGELGSQALKLEFPKFEFETGFSVKKMLQALGMKVAFQPGKADLSGLSTAAKLFIHDVIHKAYVAVDEKGTEAAAATAVTVGDVSAPQYKELTVDRPFIFTIRDRKTGAVVFAGRVVDPS